MKPIKGLVPFSVWLMAALLIYFIYRVHFDTLMTLSFTGYYYFMVLGLALLGILIAMGVALKNDVMAIVGGIGTSLIAIALIFVGGFSLAKLQAEIVIFVAGIYFAARGRG